MELTNTWEYLGRGTRTGKWTVTLCDTAGPESFLKADMKVTPGSLSLCGAIVQKVYWSIAKISLCVHDISDL